MEKKDFLVNDTCIVIQGPTDYLSIIKQNISSKIYTIFSTWTGEESKYSEEDDVVFTEPPSNPRIGNLAYQQISTMNGLLRAKELGFKKVIKLRSDVIPLDMLSFLSWFKKDLNFFYWHKNEIDGRKYCNFSTSEMVPSGYIIDYMMGGDIDLMIKLWDVDVNKHYFHAEQALTDSFINKEIYKNDHYFFGNHVTEQTDLVWIKKRILLSNYTNNPDRVFITNPDYENYINCSNYNPQAFINSEDTKYHNGAGLSPILTFDFIKSIESMIDMDSIQTIFEIGSRDACQALELCDWFTKAKVHCFEPVPVSADLCIKNCKLNSRIKFEKLAISNALGEVSFFVALNNIGGSSLYKGNKNDPYGSHWQQQEIKVQSQPADFFIKQNGINKVDLLWMDVQGSELNVLKSFGPYLQEIKAIHTEVGLSEIYENSTIKHELIEFMENNNFILVKCLTNPLGVEEDLVFVNKKYKL